MPDLYTVRAMAPLPGIPKAAIYAATAGDGMDDVRAYQWRDGCWRRLIALPVHVWDAAVAALEAVPRDEWQPIDIAYDADESADRMDYDAEFLRLRVVEGHEERR